MSHYGHGSRPHHITSIGSFGGRDTVARGTFPGVNSLDATKINFGSGTVMTHAARHKHHDPHHAAHYKHHRPDLSIPIGQIPGGSGGGGWGHFPHSPVHRNAHGAGFGRHAMGGHAGSMAGYAADRARHDAQRQNEEARRRRHEQDAWRLNNQRIQAVGQAAHANVLRAHHQAAEDAAARARVVAHTSPWRHATYTGPNVHRQFQQQQAVAASHQHDAFREQLKKEPPLHLRHGRPTIQAPVTQAPTPSKVQHLLTYLQSLDRNRPAGVVMREIDEMGLTMEQQTQIAVQTVGTEGPTVVSVRETIPGLKTTVDKQVFAWRHGEHVSVLPITEVPLGLTVRDGWWIYADGLQIQVAKRYSEDPDTVRAEMKRAGLDNPTPRDIERRIEAAKELNRDIAKFIGSGAALDQSLDATRRAHEDVLRQLVSGYANAFASFADIESVKPAISDVGRALGRQAGRLNAKFSRFNTPGATPPAPPTTASSTPAGSGSGTATPPPPAASAATPNRSRVPLIKVSWKASNRTAGTGGIKKISGARNPDGSLRVRITGVLKESIPRQNFNQELPTGRDIGLPDYEVSHLWGSGFGDEAFDGMMYAPREVNRIFQNAGIESRLRELQGLAARNNATIQVTAQAESHPLEDGHDLLRQASYRFEVRLPTGTTHTIGEVDIWVPAPGAAGKVTVEVTGGSAAVWSLQ